MGSCFSSKPKKLNQKPQNLSRHLSSDSDPAQQHIDRGHFSNYLIEIAKIPDNSIGIEKKFHSFNSLDINDEYSDPILLNEVSRANTSLKSDEIETSKQKSSFARKKYSMVRKNRNKQNVDSVSTTNATKNSSDIANNLVVNKQKISEKGENDDMEIIINDRESADPPFVNFGANHDFLNQLILTSMKTAEYEWKKRKIGPKRLTQYSSGRNVNARGRADTAHQMKLEIPSLDENSDELAPSSSLVSFSNIEAESLKFRGFCLSGRSHEIELLDLENDGSKVHVFRIPLIKNLQQITDYDLKSIPINEFEYFYKTTKLDEMLENSCGLLTSFPNTWKNSTIPYYIKKSLVFVTNSKNQSIYNLIISSIHEIQTKTSFKFVSYTPEKHSEYIHFSQSNKNHSKIGCQNGKNEITLTGKADKGVILHQIMHSLGFMHQYQRQKKDSFAYFSKDQLIHPGFFDDGLHICVSGLNFGPFDYASIMHYKSCENMIFYKDILHEGEIELSVVDLKKIDFFYGTLKSGKGIEDAWDDLVITANHNNLALQKRASLEKRLK